MKVHGYQLLGDIADRVVEGPHHPTVMKLAQRACPQAQQLASRERAEVRDAVAAFHVERIVPQVHPRCVADAAAARYRGCGDVTITVAPR